MENNQYFSKNNDNLESNPQIITAKIGDLSFKFKTDIGVFSKDFLDYASKLLLENMDFEMPGGEAVLDVGCGYGPIGIYAKKVTNNPVVMLDVNPRALALSSQNLVLNGLDAEVLESDCLDNVLDKKFGLIICNPPIHAGKNVVYKIFEQAYEVLNKNGSFWIVIQQKHGAPSAIKKLESVFEKVEITYKKKGFYIIKSTKLV
jgi:16S rRNA (guanine1207-N2)-methyltransferase